MPLTVVVAAAAVPVEVAGRLGDRRRAADDNQRRRSTKYVIADASGIVTVPPSVSDEFAVQRDRVGRAAERHVVFDHGGAGDGEGGEW